MFNFNLKLLLYILIILFSIVFIFFIPNSGLEEQIIVLISSLASAYGIYDWREKYGQFKEWFKSKTKFGAIIVSVSLLILLITPMFSIELPYFLNKILEILLLMGGGTTIIGIFDNIKTINKNNNLTTKTNNNN